MLRLTPTQRIHAVCALVVPIVMVLMVAPSPAERATATAAEPNCTAAAPAPDRFVLTTRIAPPACSNDAAPAPIVAEADTALDLASPR